MNGVLAMSAFRLPKSSEDQVGRKSRSHLYFWVASHSIRSQLIRRFSMLFRSLLTPLRAVTTRSSCVASTSASATSTSAATLLLQVQRPAAFQQQQVRTRTSLTPRRTKYRKAHKGRIPIRTGGSTAGTTLEHGDFGIRVKEPTRLSAKQLHSASEALRRGIKPVKGARVYTRVFPDIPVCIKVGQRAECQLAVS